MKNKEVTIHTHERLDALHRNGLKIIQDPKRFCFGIDAVLLSDFVKVKKGEAVLDFCTGGGIVPLLLSAKTAANHITGLEIQAKSVDMARRSVALNDLRHRITINEGDVKAAPALYKPGMFQVITVNPPYMNAGGGLQNACDDQSIARHEILCTLQDVVLSASQLLLTGGRFYMIHRPHRLTDIFITLRAHRLEPKTCRFVHATSDKEPALLLVEAARDGKPMLKILPPLFIYGTDGQYTAETMHIYHGSQNGCAKNGEADRTPNDIIR